MRDGRRIPVAQMDEHHAKNALRLILRGVREGRYKINHSVDDATAAEKAFHDMIISMVQDMEPHCGGMD